MKTGYVSIQPTFSARNTGVIFYSTFSMDAPIFLPLITGKLMFSQTNAFCTLPKNVLRAYFCDKGELIEISCNLVVHTVKLYNRNFVTPR